MASDTDPTGLGIHPLRRAIRYWVSRLVIAALTRTYVRVRLEGRERLPGGPAILCFNHLSWSDPFLLMAVLPGRPRLSFFGPKEEDMQRGGRNRLMHWTGATIPYKPGKNDLREATRRVAAAIEAGGVVAIAGEGRIGAVETALLPLNEGPAYFALRSGVPLVPIAITGSSWLRFGAQVRVQVGEPIPAAGRPDRAAMAAMTAILGERLLAMLDGTPEPPPPGRVGRWVSERFNDWPEGSREATIAAQTAGTIEPVVRAGAAPGSTAAPGVAPPTEGPAGV